MSYGSNVQPRFFGRGSEPNVDWECICGTVNRKWFKNCQMCGITKDLANEAKETK